MRRLAGLLSRDPKTPVTVEAQPARNSDIFRVRFDELTGSATADDGSKDGAGAQVEADAYSTFVVKRALDRDDRESRIYAVLREETPHLSITVPSWDLGDGWLALVDLSETHEPPVSRAEFLAGRGVPTRDRLDAIVDGLAELHTQWWEHPRLASSPLEVRDWFADEAAHGRHVERRRRELAAFETTAPPLASDTMERLRRAVDLLPRLWPRIAERG